MMNLIKIRNLSNNRIRLYQLPEDVQIPSGLMCRVPFAGETALGISTCDSWLEDDAGVATIRKALNLPMDGEFKKVLATYAETKLDYPQPAEETTEAEADPELDTACVEDNDTEETEG